MSHVKYVLDFVKVLGIITPDYWFKMPISAHFFHRLMNSKTTISLSTMAIAAVVLLFASGPIVGSQQALAFLVVHPGWGWHHGWGWHGGWGWHRHWGWHGGWGWHRHWGWHGGWGHRW
ncbi:MAG: hypothetical protein WBZ36_20910 [Candidatus Nitrosopolaris sp.]